MLVGLISLLANVALMGTSGWFITAMGIAGSAGGSLDYFTPAALIRAFAILRTGGRYGERLVSHEATFRMIAHLRTWLFRRIEPQPPTALDAYHSGDLSARLRADVDRLETVYLRIFAPLAVGLAGCLAIVAWLNRISGPFALVEGLLLGLSGLAVPLALCRTAGPTSRRQVGLSVQLTEAAIDALQGMAELQAFGAARRHVARFAEISGDLIAQQSKLGRLAGTSQAVMLLCANLALWSIVALAIPLVRNGGLPPPDLVMAALVALAGFEAVAPLPAAFFAMGGVLLSAGRIFALADAGPPTRHTRTTESFRHSRTGACEKIENRVGRASRPPFGEAESQSVSAAGVGGGQDARPTHHLANGDDEKEAVTSARLAHCDLQLTELSFRYQNNAVPVIDRFHLSLPQGKRIGLVGPAGAGKSTLILLISGLLPAGAGTISINDRPLEDYDAETVRGCFAVAPQDPRLFTGSVRDNLRLGRPDASDEALWRALKLVSLDDFVSALPDRLDCFLGEAGLTLSGGQARRLSVARALLKDAAVLVLDEPGEGLDYLTERAMLDAIVQSLGDRSLLLITHRPAGLDLMDEVIAMPTPRLI
jgi:ATP-binding cassette subfamily C protein CydC